MISLREYARHRGCSPSAISAAIKAGRLSKSVTPKGKIRSAAAADREWSATTRADYVPLSGPTAPRKRGGGAKKSGGPSLSDVRARLDGTKAELFEMDLAERRGELVPAKDLETRLVNVFEHCKAKLLGVPTDARQQDPTLSAEQLALVDRLIRNALEELATEGAPKQQPPVVAA